MTSSSPSEGNGLKSSSFLLRWRGKEEGPISLSEIERRIAANEIGLMHEVHFEGGWIPLRKFLELRAARAEAERLQKEEANRRAREQEEREAREREEQQRKELLAEEKRKNDLLEAAVRAEQGLTPEGKRVVGSSGLQKLGWVLMLGGGLIAFYFFALFDTSVTSGGGRVVNFGLMQDRQSGLLVGLGMALVGVLLVVFGKRPER